MLCGSSQRACDQLWLHCSFTSGSKISSRMVGWLVANAVHNDKSVPAHRVVNRIGMLDHRKMHFTRPEAMEQHAEEGRHTITTTKSRILKTFFGARQRAGLKIHQNPWNLGTAFLSLKHHFLIQIQWFYLSGRFRLILSGYSTAFSQEAHRTYIQNWSNSS